MVLPCNSTTSSAANARGLVQIVDVLGDHRRDLAGPVEARQRPVAAARLARRRNCSSMAKRRRQLSSRISWLARKSSNSIGWYLGPDAAGRAEIRDAAFGRDAGAGERHDHSARSTSSRSRSMPVSRSGAIMYGHSAIGWPVARSPAARRQSALKRSPCDICTPCCACAISMRRSTSTATCSA